MRNGIRLLVVDDHTLFRRGLVGLLAEQPDFLVIGEANSGQAAIELCRTQDADIVLMDIQMPGRDGVEVVRQLKRENNISVLMLTISDKDDDLLRALRAGADGYLLKNAEPEQLCRAIRQIVSGQGALSPEITARVMRAAASSHGGSPSVNLSRREKEVLLELSHGSTTSEIAATLFISRNTVKTHIGRILKKLGASNRAEAVARAIDEGLISSSS